jgi:hypothetical protein
MPERNVSLWVGSLIRCLSWKRLEILVTEHSLARIRLAVHNDAEIQSRIVSRSARAF